MCGWPFLLLETIFQFVHYAHFDLKPFHLILNRFYHQDVETINLEDFRYGGTNITAFRLISPLHKEVIAATRSLNMTEIGDRNGSHNPNGFFLKVKKLHCVQSSVFGSVQFLCKCVPKWRGMGLGGGGANAPLPCFWLC